MIARKLNVHMSEVLDRTHFEDSRPRVLLLKLFCEPVALSKMFYEVLDVFLCEDVCALALFRSTSEIVRLCVAPFPSHLHLDVDLKHVLVEVTPRRDIRQSKIVIPKRKGIVRCVVAIFSHV